MLPCRMFLFKMTAVYSPDGAVSSAAVRMFVRMLAGDPAYTWIGSVAVTDDWPLSGSRAAADAGPCRSPPLRRVYGRGS